MPSQRTQEHDRRLIFVDFAAILVKPENSYFAGQMKRSRIKIGSHSANFVKISIC